MPDIFKEHISATPSVNRLAGNIRDVLNFYAPHDVTSKLYRMFLSLLRKAKSKQRLILMAALENMEAHPRNRLNDVLPGIQLEATEEGNCIVVKLNYNNHPELEKEQKYYRMKAILLTWNNRDQEVAHASKHSMWIHPTDNVKRYTFRFDVTENTTDYMLVCDCIRAEEKGELRMPPKHSLRIFSVGSLDKAALAALEDRRAADRASKITERHDWSQEDDGEAGEEK